MRTLRRLLVVLAVAIAGTLTFALPASAHTGAFTRDCDSVHLHLTLFGEGHNQVTVTRNGEFLQNVDFDGRTADADFPETSTDEVVYEASWTREQTSDHNESRTGTKHLSRPGDCQDIPECAESGDLSYDFNGEEGTATVTLGGELPLCEPTNALLVSYETEGPDAETSGHHTVVDSAAAQIVEPGDYPLSVDLPDCTVEVDLYITDQDAADFDAPDNPLADALASTVLAGKGPSPSVFNGGTVCETEPTAAPSTPAGQVGDERPPLANTGASSTVPLTIAGIALVGLGVGLTMFTRHRRRASHARG